MSSEEEIPSFQEARRTFEADYVRRVLRHCRGSITAAARVAKKERKDFYRLMQNAGVDPDQFRKKKEQKGGCDVCAT